MKKKQILIGLSILGVACSSPKVDPSKDHNESAESKELKSLEFDYLDTTAKPADDFYQYANGTWLVENPIPEEESRWSSFNELDDRNNNILNTILVGASEKPGEKGSATQLIGDYYASFIDTIKRNELGIAPINDDLESINSIKTVDEISSLLAGFHNKSINSFFDLYVGQDAKINSLYRVHISQGGLGLPNKDYYFKEDERSKNIRNAYTQHIDAVFQLAKIEGSNLPVYGIEENLASVSMGPVELRDYEKQYNVMSVDELQILCPAINWQLYFSERGIENLDSVVVGQPDFMKKMNDVLVSSNLNDLKQYMTWDLLSSSSNALTMDFSREHFSFYSTTLRGTKKMKPMWKQGIMVVTGSSIGEALGEAFVEENFSEEAKRKVTEMVDNITLVFDQRIEDLDWMSDSTKAKAKEKLGSFARKLGFPDNWKDYSTLTIDRDSYAKNVFNTRAFGVKENIDQLGTSIDKSKWEMVPQIVNAYYNPLLNEIVFPAGIMQAPFFSEDYEDAVNYARMGAVIGHELTHGFDDQGAQFDSEGRMENWWSKEDKAKFDEKTQKLIEQYNAFEVLEGVFVNGELTLGENIADLGGLTIAYHAYQKSLEGKEKKEINGFTNEQRFFLAFAQVWKNNIREDALVSRIKGDPHSPGKYRVNGTLSNMPEFFEAFTIPEGSAMRQNEESIAKIW